MDHSLEPQSSLTDITISRLRGMRIEDHGNESSVLANSFDNTTAAPIPKGPSALFRPNRVSRKKFSKRTNTGSNKSLDRSTIERDTSGASLKPRPIKVKLPSRQPDTSMLSNGTKWLAERSKVFVCIDLELWEINNNYLTEVGIAVYDPTVIPKDRSLPILPKIRACHYVVEEHKSKVNGKFVPNNMFKFSYGETLVMPLDQCKLAVNKILASLAKNNNLVIVGHGVSGDIQVLRKHGCIIPKHDILDTSTIWRTTRKEGFGSLGKLLEYFNIPHGLMHNAGNDAYLNLYLFLVLCDPEVRLDRKLDEDQDPDEKHNLVSERRRKGRRRDIPPLYRNTEAEDAVTLMLGSF